MTTFATSSNGYYSVNDRTGALTWVAAKPVVEPTYDQPGLVGSGPPECSSCKDLVSVRPAWIWDVNGYYRELGVPVDATRSEIGRRYIEINGQSSVRLTFIYKQLIHADVREAYDACELGTTFIDPWVHQEMYLEMKRRAMIKASEETEAGLLRPDDFNQRVDGIMDWLSESIKAFSDNLPSTLDQESLLGDDGLDPANARPTHFQFSYYLWKTKPLTEVDQRLLEWQSLLLQAMGEKSIRTRFAIGLTGFDRPWVFARIAYRDVFFFSRDLDPDIEVARTAVRQTY